MGQAKNRKAEIDAIKASNPNRIKWADIRPEFVARIKKDQEVYINTLMTANKDNIMEVMRQADQDRLDFAVRAGTGIVLQKIATVEQIKDAAWQGFNGLMEAVCVAQNIQHNLGLPVDEVDPDQFIFTGPDAMERARKVFAVV